MQVTVNSSQGLLSALSVAKAGDVIQLAPGTYSPVLIKNIAFSSDVTITSADPNKLAVVTGLDLRGVQGLTFKNLEVFVDPAKPENPVRLSGSQDIHFDRLKVHGSLDGNAGNDVGAMLIRSSKDVSVTNSEFQQLKFGISHLDSSQLNFSGNYFHDIRVDGIRGGGSSQVTIAKNYFTDFRPAAGDHADAIQFWTTNTDASARDIVVSENVVLRGNGGATQGIFFRDQVGDLPYQNVAVTGNLVVGTIYHGIWVAPANKLTVTDNVVVGLADQKAWLGVAHSTNVVISNNKATSFNFDQAALAASKNSTTVSVPADGGRTLVEAWTKAHSTVVMPLVSSGSFVASVKNAMDTMEATRKAMVTATGTAGNDRLYADGVHDMHMKAGAGDDMLTGGGVGHNTMSGGAGNDTYYVKSGYDVLVENAKEGDDLAVASVDYTLADNVERLRMAGDAHYGAGNALGNRMTGTAKDNEIHGMGGDDHVQAGDGADLVRGGDGNDTLAGEDGNDAIFGDAGSDKLSGNEGSDTLNGGAGSDTLEGNSGADVMTGGAGADQFVFRDGTMWTGERITDFSHAEGDVMSLSLIDANTNLAGNQKFSFLGTSKFSKKAGELRYEVKNGEAHVQGDLNGDGTADFTLVLNHVTTLHSSDFLL